MTSRALLDDLLDDLTAEGDALRAVVTALEPDAWATPTPAEGWTVAHQVAHLAWTDEQAVAAARTTDPERWPDGGQAWDAIVTAALADVDGFVDAGAEELAALPTEELLARWDAGRVALGEALRAVPAGAKMPWFGPPMSPTSMATARYMETWAHALDVYDAVANPAAEGGRPLPTDRIRHVAHLGIRTRDFAYSVHQEQPPAEEFRVELTAPSGEVWTWGPEDAAQGVTGSAYDFCCLVTQRVHRDDTDLVATGDDAEHWLTIAQAFAGPAGGGREKRG
jgi:uncharacterized protein (TIGR03084 family)